MTGSDMRSARYVVLVLWLFGGCGGTPPQRARPPPPLSLTAFVARAPIRVLVGRASYYHDSLAGNLTANGERYDPRGLTAASRNLPFDTIVRTVRRIACCTHSA